LRLVTYFSELVLIEREGYLIKENFLINGHCPVCGRNIPGIWQLAPAQKVFPRDRSNSN